MYRCRKVLGDLGQQRDLVKGTQKRLCNLPNTLGTSGDPIPLAGQRAKAEKWFFHVGTVISLLFYGPVLSYLR